ncbi:MAG: autoinducer binding domain-containing protein [Marivivens sp.]|nr:autoinducer binding domain-containing protein [Marivivens sp.]
MTDVIAPYGYTTFIYGRIFGAPIDPLTTPVVTNLSSDWMQYYTEQKFYLAVFAADHCRTGSGALLWSEADRKIASGSGPKNMRSSARPRAPLGWGLA